MINNISRGDLFYANLEDITAIGSEQVGIRPVVILQNEWGNLYSPTVIIAPITSKSKAKLPTHITLKKSKGRLKKDSIILLEQIKTIDKERLSFYIGKLDKDEITKLNKSLLIALGINIEEIRKIKNNNEIENIIDEKSLYKVAKDKEEKTEFITRRQIASYGIIAKEYLKHSGNIEISNNLFGEYMLTLMELYSPVVAEKKADEFRNERI